MILIADDDRPNLECAADVLRRLGYQVIEASGSEEAMRLSSEYDGKVSLLLVNIEMQNPKGGAPLWQAFKDRHPGMGLVGMGAHFDHAPPSGIEILRKPLSLVDLVMKVEGAYRRMLEPRG